MSSGQYRRQRPVWLVLRYFAWLYGRCPLGAYSRRADYRPQPAGLPAGPSSPPMGLAARCIARRCSPISRCRARRPRATSRRPIKWIGWLDRYAQDENRWFSWISLNGTTLDDTQQQGFVRRYSKAAGDVDAQIDRVLTDAARSRQTR